MSELQEARKRMSDMLADLRSRGVPTGEFGEDLDLLLDATAPKERTKPALKPTASRVRRRDPGTSWDAAALVSHERSREMYDVIHQTLKVYVPQHGGLTDQELVLAIRNLGHGWADSGIRSRRAELVEAGWVVDSGARRATQHKRQSVVWKSLG